MENQVIYNLPLLFIAASSLVCAFLFINKISKLEQKIFELKDEIKWLNTRMNAIVMQEIQDEDDRLRLG